MNDEKSDYKDHVYGIDMQMHGDFDLDHHDGYTETNKEILETVSQTDYDISQFKHNFRTLKSFLELLVVPIFNRERLYHLENMFDAALSMNQTIKTQEYTIKEDIHTIESFYYFFRLF